jgi:hypothetical protein
MISPSLFECFWPAGYENEEKGAVLYFVMSCHVTVFGVEFY